MLSTILIIEVTIIRITRIIRIIKIAGVVSSRRRTGERRGGGGMICRRRWWAARWCFDAGDESYEILKTKKKRKKEEGLRGPRRKENVDRTTIGERC